MMTQKEFIERSSSTHKDQYDYSKVEYSTQDRKVKIVCAQHGEFFQRPADHMRGAAGCPLCGATKRAQNRRRWSKERVLEKAIQIHGNRFEYRFDDFRGFNGPLHYRCPDHGWKTTLVKSHIWRGDGCKECSGKARRTTSDFIQEARDKHGDVYDYSSVAYINAHTPVSIKCRTHGHFEQSPISHARAGARCPKCAASSTSKMESEWLDKMGVTERLIRRDGFCFDGYDSSTNTVYEFYGDYWHGNPARFSPDEINQSNGRTFGELFKDTMDREKKLISLGYNLTTTWEMDFKKQ